MIGRRGLIKGLISMVAAPAIVKAESIMPVKVVDWGDDLYVSRLRLDPIPRVHLQGSLVWDGEKWTGMRALADPVSWQAGPQYADWPLDAPWHPFPGPQSLFEWKEQWRELVSRVRRETAYEEAREALRRRSGMTKEQEDRYWG